MGHQKAHDIQPCLMGEGAERFEDFDLSEFEDLLVQGKNVLAIRGINASSSGSDMLILPELAAREVLFGINPNAQVYYTTDGTDPRAPDGSVSPAAKLAEAGQSVTFAENTRHLLEHSTCPTSSLAEPVSSHHLKVLAMTNS